MPVRSTAITRRPLPQVDERLESRKHPTPKDDAECVLGSRNRAFPVLQKDQVIAFVAAINAVPGCGFVAFLLAMRTCICDYCSVSSPSSAGRMFASTYVAITDRSRERRKIRENHRDRGRPPGGSANRDETIARRCPRGGLVGTEPARARCC